MSPQNKDCQSNETALFRYQRNDANDILFWWVLVVLIFITYHHNHDNCEKRRFLILEIKMPIHYKLSRQRTILGKDRLGLTDKHVMWLYNTCQHFKILDNTRQNLEKISQVWQICMWCDLTSPCVTLGRPGLPLSDLVHIRLLRRQPWSPKHDDDAYFAQDKRASIP